MVTTNGTSNLLMRGRRGLAATVALFALAGLAGLVTMNRQRVLASGTFHPVARPGAGWVRIVGHGRDTSLQLIDIRLQNAPELEIRLVAASDVLDNSTVEAIAFVNVGSLFPGARSGAYSIDAAADLARYRAVTLWSPATHLNFMTAPLQAAGQSRIGASEK